MITLRFEVGSSESNGILLGLSYCPFSFERKSLKELEDSARFIKFSVESQKGYLRKFSQQTLEWWKEQNKSYRNLVFNPSENDVNIGEGLSQFQKDAFTISKEFDEKPLVVFVRGYSQTALFNSLCSLVLTRPIFPESQYFELRTLLKFNANSDNGVLNVDHIMSNSKYPSYDPRFKVVSDVFQIYDGLFSSNIERS